MTIKHFLILLVLLTLSTTVQAQRFNQKKIVDGARYGQWEAALLLQGQGGTSESSEGGSSVDIDDAWGWGFSIGWNWTENWHLSYRFALAKPKYTAIIVPEDEEPLPPIDYEMSKYSNQFNVTYHFLKGPLTPFVQAGLGWTKLDSNVPNAPPVTGCWWDPWWGYICNTTWSTYDTTEFSYNAGLGLRWDINGAFFMRGTYNREWISLDNSNLNFDTLTLEAGIMW